MKKKFTRIALILGLTGILSINTFAAVTFKDVSNTHWAYPGVAYMQEKGYMTKNSAGEFLPNQEVSYFDIAEILAKATGYKDELVNKDMTEKEKQDIRSNYQLQLPRIQQYESKYKGWNKSSNEEIAYILGRGYIDQSDLAKFMVKTADGKEVKNTVTKQDLAKYLVFVLGKANTAVNEYKGTGFSDEAQIKEENRPYVAYLKKLNLVSGDVDGKFNPNAKVTRSVCASMTANVLRHKVETEVTTPTPTPEPENKVIKGTIYNMVPRNNEAGETLILVQVDGTNKFYTANAQTVIKDSTGKALTIQNVKVNDQVHITLKGSGDVIDTLTVQGEVKPEVTTSVHVGEVDRIGRNGDLTIQTSEGAITAMLSSECKFLYNGQAVTLEQVALGDRVRVSVQNNKITEVQILEKKVTPAQKVEFVKLSNKPGQYVLTTTDGKTEQQVTIDKDVVIYRGGKKVSVQDLCIGDTLTLEKEGNKVVEIKAEFEENTIVGRVKKIVISNMPEVVVETKKGEVTVAITGNTELYDSNRREDITLRDLLLGMEVEVITESKEAISLVVEKAPSKVTYKGVIDYIGSGTRYIDVVVEYDAITGDTMTIKRINVPNETKVIMDRKEVHRNNLDEGMEVLVTFNYGEELHPESIEILRK